MSPQPPHPLCDLKLLYMIFVLCLISLLAFRSSRYLFVLLTSLSAYILTQYSEKHQDGTSNHVYVVGMSWSLMLAYGSHLVLLSDPQLHLRYNGQKEPAYKLPILQRLWWATSLLFNSRGINWNCEIPALRRSKLHKWAFVRSEIGSAILSLLVHDTLRFHTTRNPAFQAGSGVTMGSAGFLWQIWNVVVFWMIVVTRFQCGQSLVAAAAVAIGWSTVDDWPTWFGPWRHATSVRNFWGQTWHQSLRQYLSGHGKYVARSFNLSKGSAASAYTQLYVAFLISGICHCAGDWVARHSIDGVGRTMAFFMLQAMAITFEDMIIAGQKRLGAGVGIGKHSLFSYLWVFLWLTWSTPIWFETKIGVGGGAELPFSLLGFLEKNNLVAF